MSETTDSHGPRGTLRLIEGGVGKDPLAAAIEAEQTVREPARFDLGNLVQQANQRAQSAPNAGGSADFGSGLPRAGDRFKDWIVIREHAKGGLSYIYEVAHIASGLRQALKILQPLPRTRPVLVDKQRAEGNLLIHLRGNPYLCDVYDVGTSPEYGPYVVMELLTGSSLAALIKTYAVKSQRFKLERAVKLGIDVAEGLHMMHSLGVIHRDVKPDNIFIVPITSPDGDKPETRVKLIDFGTARSHLSPKTSAENTTVATPKYAAPEVLSRDPITGAADQFSLAVVLHEMLWEHPYVEAERRGVSNLLQHLHRLDELDAPPPHLVPPGLWRVLARALSRRADARFPSMRAFAQALRAFLQTGWELAPVPAAQRVPIKPTIPSSRLVPGASFSGPRETPAAPPTERRSPKRALGLTEPFEGASLLVLAPPELRGQRFELGPEGVIGRHPAQADLVLGHETVSNQHLRYAYVTGGDEAPVYAIEDLGSSNGTDLGGLPVYTSAIKTGEMLGLGDVLVCVVPAGIVRPDLRVFTPLADIAKPSANPTTSPRRAVRRRVALEQSWPGPTLVVLAPDSLHGARFDLGSRGTIGRVEGLVDIALAEDTVSAQHVSYSLVTAGFLPEDVVYLLEDLNSANGTAVAPKKGHDPDAISSAPIRGGQTILIGSVQAVIAPPGHIRERAGRFEFVLSSDAAGASLRSMDASSSAMKRAAARPPVMALIVATCAALIVATVGLFVLWRLGMLESGASR